mmetsp:Transcript_25446/g.55258  ORF Transcript_25446/g.55258 Transcript_25446/m.55258 type:complete len:238 (-) Transcript_25446:914-1627(-)
MLMRCRISGSSSSSCRKRSRSCSSVCRASAALPRARAPPPATLSASSTSICRCLSFQGRVSTPLALRLLRFSSKLFRTRITSGRLPPLAINASKSMPTSCAVARSYPNAMSPGCRRWPRCVLAKKTVSLRPKSDDRATCTSASAYLWCVCPSSSTSSTTYSTRALLEEAAVKGCRQYTLASMVVVRRVTGSMSVSWLVTLVHSTMGPSCPRLDASLAGRQHRSSLHTGTISTEKVYL